MLLAVGAGDGRTIGAVEPSRDTEIIGRRDIGVIGRIWLREVPDGFPGKHRIKGCASDGTRRVGQGIGMDGIGGGKPFRPVTVERGLRAVGEGGLHGEAKIAGQMV